MGLDIIAYGDIKQVEVPSDDLQDQIEEGEVFRVFTDDDFPGRAAGLKELGVYTYSKRMDFRAGSYGGYNDWREALAKMAGYPASNSEKIRHTYSCGAWKATEGPFWEMINFSDCEGFIGPAVAAKLAEDFKKFEHEARASLVPHFWELYSQWSKAFDLAARNGCVEFH